MQKLSVLARTRAIAAAASRAPAARARVAPLHTTALAASTSIPVIRAQRAQRPDDDMSLFQRYVKGVATQIKHISVSDAHKMLHATRYGPHQNVHLIDVREPVEWNLERIPKAEYFGRGTLERDVESKFPDTADTLIVYCASGMRSVLAADSLTRMGYDNVYSLDEGLMGWKNAGHELERGTEVFSPRFSPPSSH